MQLTLSCVEEVLLLLPSEWGESSGMRHLSKFLLLWGVVICGRVV